MSVHLIVAYLRIRVWCVMCVFQAIDAGVNRTLLIDNTSAQPHETLRTFQKGMSERKVLTKADASQLDTIDCGDQWQQLLETPHLPVPPQDSYEAGKYFPLPDQHPSVSRIRDLKREAYQNLLQLADQQRKPSKWLASVDERIAGLKADGNVYMQMNNPDWLNKRKYVSPAINCDAMTFDKPPKTADVDEDGDTKIDDEQFPEHSAFTSPLPLSHSSFCGCVCRCRQH